MLHLHLETKKENMPFIEGPVVLFGKWITHSVSTSMTINIKKKNPYQKVQQHEMSLGEIIVITVHKIDHETLSSFKK